MKVFLAPIGTLLPETSDDVPDVGGLGAKHVGAERKAAVISSKFSNVLVSLCSYSACLRWLLREVEL